MNVFNLIEIMCVLICLVNKIDSNPISNYLAILSSNQWNTEKQEAIQNALSQAESDSSPLNANSKSILSNELNPNEQLIATNENDYQRVDESHIDLKNQVQESNSDENQNVQAYLDLDTNSNQSESEVSNLKSNEENKVVYSNSNYINNEPEETNKQFDALEANDDQNGQSYGKNLIENLHNKELNIPVEDSNENDANDIVNNNVNSYNNNINSNSQMSQLQAGAVLGSNIENVVNAQEDGVDELENDDYA